MSSFLGGPSILSAILEVALVRCFFWEEIVLARWFWEEIMLARWFWEDLALSSILAGPSLVIDSGRTQPCHLSWEDLALSSIFGGPSLVICLRRT